MQANKIVTCTITRAVVQIQRLKKVPTHCYSFVKTIIIIIIVVCDKQYYIIMLITYIQKTHKEDNRVRKNKEIIITFRRIWK